MKELKEWHFDFGLMSAEDGVLVSEDQASSIMDAIIDLVESRGMAVAGTMGPYEEE